MLERILRQATSEPSVDTQTNMHFEARIVVTLILWHIEQVTRDGGMVFLCFAKYGRFVQERRWRCACCDVIMRKLDRKRPKMSLSICSF